MKRQHLELIIDNIASEIEAFNDLSHPYIVKRLRELRKIWSFSNYEIAVSLDLSFEEVSEVFRSAYKYKDLRTSQFVVKGNLRNLKFVPVKIKAK